MPQIKRRQFLQFAGSALATLGLSQLDIVRQGDRYARVLAQETRRKLALLVGVNDYSISGLPSLLGCLTDVEMQFELLVHRYGFNPKDILRVTDTEPTKPTRANILQAFEEHLIKQAKPGDVVIFHYSGHGSRVTDPNPLPGPKLEGKNGTLVPSDGRSVPTSDDGQVQDIMGRTLFLLMYALQTENVTVVLDSCHSGGGTRGNLVFRAVPARYGGGEAQPSAEELAYQEQWLARLNLSPVRFQELRRQGIAKGVALGSAQANQLAADAPFGDFHAGAFTYLLTRYLWQQPTSQPLKSVFVSLARKTQDVAQSARVEQEPIYAVQPGSQLDQQPVYLLESPLPAAEAVVRETKGQQIEFWLGGISSQSLQAFEQGAVFNLIDDQGEVQGEVEQTSRVGLVGYGKLRQGQSQAGTLMRERVRGVPSNLTLRLGLAPSLEELTATARSALQTVSRVEPVPVNQRSVTDYLLGRMTATALKVARREQGVDPAPIGSIGLFTAGLTAVPDSFGPKDETVEAAIQRLRPRLKRLLAGRILASILNSNASSLQVGATVERVGARGIARAFGSRGVEEAGILSQAIATNDRKLTPGTEIQVQVENQEDQNLYIGVLVIASNGNLVVLHPVDWDAPEDAALVAPGQVLTVPRQSNNPDNDFRFIVQGPAGFFELLVLASTEPLRNALRGLQRIAGSRGSRSGDPLDLQEDEPVEVMDALLSDLDQSTRAGVTSVRGNHHSVDSTKLAALSAVMEVVESSETSRVGGQLVRVS